MIAKDYGVILPEIWFRIVIEISPSIAAVWQLIPDDNEVADGFKLKLVQAFVLNETTYGLINHHVYEYIKCGVLAQEIILE